MNGNKEIRMKNAPRRIEESPIAGICQVGALPLLPVEGINVCWTSIDFCTVSQMAAMAAVQLAGYAAGASQNCTLPTTQAASYMMRMNYYKILNIKGEERFKRHAPAARFVPLTVIPIDEMSADPGGTADMLTEVIRENTSFTDSATDIMSLSFGEVIDNIVQHSEAGSPGIAGAQWFPNLGYVEICVADCGIGIPKSMSMNDDYHGMSNDKLLEKAFECCSGQWYGKSVYGSREVSGGMGLCYSARLVRALGGHLWAVSHSSAIHISEDGTERVGGLYYPGTVIVMRLPNTKRELLDTDVFPDGRGLPLRYKPGEGQYVEESDVLW